MGWGGARANSGRKKQAKGADAPKLELVGGTETLKLPAPSVPAEAKKAAAMSVAAMQAVIEASKQLARDRGRREELNPFRLPAFPTSAVPTDPKLQMAMDDACQWGATQWAGGYGGYLDGQAAEGLLFPGYPYLSELAQRPEYRTFADTIATEMTRKWIKLTSRGSAEEKEKAKKKKEQEAAGEPPAQDDAIDPGSEQEPPGKKQKPPTDKDDNRTAQRIQELTQFLDDLRARDRYADMAKYDSFFGRGHLFHDCEQIDAELKTPIATVDGKLLKGKIGGKIKLKRLQPVEPMWAYPTTYNARNPLKPDWYNPQVWYVMGQEIHRTRFPTFIGRPVPDMLKPAYAFGGLSLSQLAKPYVDIWLTTRQSVGELIHAFSVMVLMTDLHTILQPGNADALLARVAMFNALRDNQGAFVINKMTEDFKNVSASLAGLDHLQAQAQEHMMSVARIPAVKFTGIQPTGLNASSEGEIRTWYDTIRAFQNYLFRPKLNFTLDMAMVTLWGQTDPDIVYDFEPLWDQTEKEKGEKRKADAETGQIHIDSGVISPEEERRRIIDDPDSPYQGLDPDDVPELAQEEEDGLMPGGKKPGEEPGGGGDDDGADPDLDDLEEIANS